MSLWIVIFPFDVVKSRMQIHQTDLSMLSLILKISRDEGMTLHSPILCLIGMA